MKPLDTKLKLDKSLSLDKLGNEIDEEENNPEQKIPEKELVQQTINVPVGSGNHIEIIDKTNGITLRLFSPFTPLEIMNGLIIQTYDFVRSGKKLKKTKETKTNYLG